MMNQPVEGKPGRYWRILPDGRLQCDLCPRYCKLQEGQRGLCFVRARQGDQMGIAGGVRNLPWLVLRPGFETPG